MATELEVLELRRLINEPEPLEPFTDKELSDRLDADTLGVRHLAAQIWTEKAAGYADLTDVQEGSSRRALGDLHEQALKMAGSFDAGIDSDRARRRRAGTRPIVRP